MKKWSKNHRACTTTWVTLYLMNQLESNFDTSGKAKMSDLTFYNKLASAELRQQEAIIIADQMDRTFKLGRGAIYEDSVTRTDAIFGMVKILINEDKTVFDLAKIIDDKYLLWNEKVEKNENS